MKEEPVDILDEQGNKTGKTMLKSEAHKKGLWHGAAHAWVYNSKGEILLQLRSKKKIVWPGVWDVSVAGHIRAGMEPRETVAEEAREELGMIAKPSDLEFLGNGKVDDEMPGGWKHRVYLWVYALKLDVEIDKLTFEEEETDAAQWVPIDSLASQLTHQAAGNRLSSIKDSYELAAQGIPKLIKGSR